MDPQLGQGDVNIVDFNLIVDNSEVDTPLHIAASKGNLENVRQILMPAVDDLALKCAGHNCFPAEGDKKQVHHHAAYTHYLSFVDKRNSSGCTPLHLASCQGCVDVVELLLACGANPGAENNEGLTPLGCATIGSGDVQIKHLLWKKKSDSTSTPLQFPTALHYASYHGHLEIVNQLMLRGVDGNPRDNDGNTPLHHAAERGYAKTIDSLLKNGANANLKNKIKQTPLHLAAKMGHDLIVRRLLENKDNIDVQDESGKTALHLATIEGHAEAVTSLLKHGANHTIQDNKDRIPIRYVGSGELLSLHLVHAYRENVQKDAHRSLQYEITYGEDITPTAVRQEVSRRTGNIFNRHDCLRKILGRHEHTIQQRWMKKSPGKRLKVLRAVWPEMPPKHRPDFAAFLAESRDQTSKDGKNTNSYMYPHINQKDLSAEPNALLLLLDARGYKPPSTFASVDSSAMRLGRISGAIKPRLLRNHSMFLDGVDSKEEYGVLRDWSEYPDLRQNQTQFSPGEGLLVLQAQEMILSFLVGCCEKILSDIPRAALESSSFSIKGRSTIASDDQHRDSLSVIAFEVPYRVPAQMDLNHIELLLKTRLEHAENHIQLLRQDPSYFAETMAMHVHTNEKPNIGSFTDVVFDALDMIEQFDALQRHIEGILEPQGTHSAFTPPSQNPPNQYLLTVVQFRWQIIYGIKAKLTRMEPMLEDCLKNSQATTEAKDYIQWLIKESLGGHLVFLLPEVMDELEHSLVRNPNVQRLLSERLHRMIGDISLLSNCLMQLENYQPWARSFDDAAKWWSLEIASDLCQRNLIPSLVMEYIQPRNAHRLLQVFRPGQEVFEYPDSKRQTEKTVNTKRRFETQVEMFWNQMHDMLALKGKHTISYSVLKQPSIMLRTAQWNGRQVSNKQTPAGPSSSLDMSVHHICSNNQPNTCCIGESSQRLKVKRKGVPNKPKMQSAEEVEPAVSGNEVVKRKYFVDDRAMKVFNTLFHNPNDKSHSKPGEIPWKDFVYAMTKTGFAAQKQLGSSWIFTRREGGTKTAIHFHGPHPKPKIPYKIAKGHAKRLGTKYGWTIDTFELS